MGWKYQAEPSAIRKMNRIKGKSDGGYSFRWNCQEKPLWGVGTWAGPRESRLRATSIMWNGERMARRENSSTFCCDGVPEVIFHGGRMNQGTGLAGALGSEGGECGASFRAQKLLGQTWVFCKDAALRRACEWRASDGGLWPPRTPSAQQKAVLPVLSYKCSWKRFLAANWGTEEKGSFAFRDSLVSLTSSFEWLGPTGCRLLLVGSSQRYPDPWAVLNTHWFSPRGTSSLWPEPPPAYEVGAQKILHWPDYLGRGTGCEHVAEFAERHIQVPRVLCENRNTQL